MQSLDLTDELFSNIIDYMAAKKLSYNTRRTYYYTLKKIWKDYKVLDSESCRKLLKKFNHQNQRAVLVLINRYCYSENLDFKINIPTIARQKKKKTIKTLSLDEIDVMIKATPKPYDLMLKCIFKIGGGLRISEAIKLSWHHFFWADWLKNKALGSVLIKDSKGDDRIVPLPKALMEEIYEYAKEQELTNEFGIPIGAIIFKTRENFRPELKTLDLERWKDRYVQASYKWFQYHILKKHCEKTLGHKVRIHSLRHTRATQLYDDGIPIEIIQQMLGHKEITTTMIYTQVSNKKVFNAMKDVD